MNLNFSSYDCWYFPLKYPKLTNKFKKQPVFSRLAAFSGPTTCMYNSFFAVLLPRDFWLVYMAEKSAVHIECVELLHSCRAWRHLHLNFSFVVNSISCGRVGH